MPALKKLFRQNENGMTLIEVLAALVLLVLLSTTIAAVFTPASMWVQQARSETIASNYARGVLENLRADRTELNNAQDEEYEININEPSGMSTRIGIKQREDLDNLYDVMVTVTWNQGKLEMQTVMRGK